MGGQAGGRGGVGEMKGPGGRGALSEGGVLIWHSFSLPSLYPGELLEGQGHVSMSWRGAGWFGQRGRDRARGRGAEKERQGATGAGHMRLCWQQRPWVARRQRQAGPGACSWLLQPFTPRTLPLAPVAALCPHPHPCCARCATGHQAVP